MIELILFFIAILIGIFAIINALAFVRMKMGNVLHSSLLIQPFSSGLISKNYLLALAFLETPVILTLVVGILSFDFFNYENINIIFMPALYILFCSLSAAITIFFSGNNMGNFLSLFSVHPQFESQFMVQFFILISTIQAPFIIFFVALLYHKYFLINNIQLFYFGSGFYFFTIALFIMLLCIQFFLSYAISNIIRLLKKPYLESPYNINSLFLLLIMQMGFLQAPYIFAFIVFIILFKIFYFKFHFIYYLFGFFVLLFSLCASIVVFYSGKMVASALSKLNANSEKNISLMKFALIGQILLDARILYIILIILFGINFFN